MLAALRERLTTASGKVAERLAAPLSYITAAYDTILPYAVKTFHYGFIPLVLYLGMRSDPKLKLEDLLLPM